jgi:hypothetical protein
MLNDLHVDGYQCITPPLTVSEGLPKDTLNCLMPRVTCITEKIKRIYTPTAFIILQLFLFHCF